MNANVVYQVVKALPKEEQTLLLDLLKKDCVVVKRIKRGSKQILTKQEAFTYLLKNVFAKKKNKCVLNNRV